MISKKTLYFLSITSLVAVLFSIANVLVFVSSEHPVYYWDFVGYHSMWENLSELIFSNPPKALFQFAGTIFYSDYNVSSVALPALLRLWFLPSRLAYILSISIFYLVPTSLLFSFLLKRITGLPSLPEIILSFTLALTFTGFWAPTLRGFPDIAGIVFILIALIAFTYVDLKKEQTLKTLVFLGVLLWAPFLMRRWYAYTIVSLYISVPALIAFLQKEELSGDKLKKITKNFLLIGLSSLGFALFFQLLLIVRIARTDYSFIYSAYQNPFLFSLTFTTYSLGLYLIPFIILGSLTGLLSKERNLKTWTFFFLFNLIFSFFLFTRTQSPGMQHILPFALWSLLLASLGLQAILRKIPKESLRWAWVASLALCSLYINLSTFYPSPLLQNASLNKILPYKVFPLRIGNFEEYERLSQELKTLLEESGENAIILSSSGSLNIDTVKNLLHASRNTRKKIEFVSEVDSRDKIRLGNFFARYVVTADPVQRHLKAKDQQVILYPAQSILDGLGIGKIYERIQGPYELENNIKAYIYERKRDPNLEELEEYVSHFFTSYPQWREIYTRDKLQEAIDQFSQKK